MPELLLTSEDLHQIYSPSGEQVEDESLAWDVAHAMDPFETRRLRWESILDRLGAPLEVFGKVGVENALLSELANESIAEGVGDIDLEQSTNPTKAWIKEKVEKYHRKQLGSHFANVSRPHRDMYGDKSKRNGIPTGFVYESARDLIKYYKTRSYVGAQAIYLTKYASENIARMEESLGETGQEVFARPVEDESRRFTTFYLHHYDFVPEEAKELERREFELVDIIRRREAYFALNEHFGGSATPETVTREDVDALRGVLEDHYVDLRFRGYRG